MQTKLSRICEAIIEAGWLAALIVTPLFFNTSSSRVFEPDKLHLLRSIALVMAVAWIVQLLDTGLSGWIRERGGGFWIGHPTHAAGFAHTGPRGGIYLEHGAVVGAPHQLPRLVRAHAGHVHVHQLCSDLLHGADASADSRPDQPDLLRDHPQQPADLHLRHHPALRPGPLALGRRRTRARGRKHGQRDLRRGLPDHRPVPHAGTAGR